jgi:DNA-directed RNA polymerase subunit RPC12/RpoP
LKPGRGWRKMEEIPIFRCPKCGSKNFHYVKRVEFDQCVEFQFDRVVVNAPANQDAYPLYIKPSDPIWCEKCGYKLKRKEREEFINLLAELDEKGKVKLVDLPGGLL